MKKANNTARSQQPKKRGVQSSHISNNLLAALAVLFMLTSIVSTTYVFVQTEDYIPKVVGRATLTTSANINLTILGRPPGITIEIPYSCEVLSDVVVLNASVVDWLSNDSITNVSFYYSPYRDQSEWFYIGSDYYDGDVYYNISWDTNGLLDGIYYSIEVIAQDTDKLTADVKIGYLTVNNWHNEPDWSSFKNSRSTNLSQLTEWWNVSDLVLGNEYGLINFSGRVLNVDGINLSSYFHISMMKISLDETDLPCLNGPTYLHFLGVNITNVRVLRDGIPCPSYVCSLISNSNGTAVIKISEFGSYEVTENAYLDIWDITDRNRYPGNQERHRFEWVNFYANLTSGGISLNNTNISCYIWFNTSWDWGFQKMNFGNLSLYEYRRIFVFPGVYAWNVTCNSTLDSHLHTSGTNTVLITNRPPILLSNLPNITMKENTVLQYITNLYNYFQDPDGDLMVFNASYVPNVNVQVVGSRIIVTPDRDWWGNRTFVVSARDEWGLSNTSNIIHLSIAHVTPPIRQDTGGGGGGSGDTSSGLQGENNLYICRDNWVCSEWSECRYLWAYNDTNVTQAFFNAAIPADENDGIRVRSCFDLNQCQHWWISPNETEDCYYIPGCDDLILNGNETGVDCGGKCKPCPSCTNGVHDAGEEGVDCGGPCQPCGTCFDGVANCHDGRCEDGIDCGGTCVRSCPVKEEPTPNSNLFTIILLALLALSLLVTFYLFIKPYMVRLYMLILAARKRKKEPLEPTLLELETEYLLQLEKLRKMAARAEPSRISSKLNRLMKEFIIKVFEIKTELSLEELIEAIRKSEVPSMLKITLGAYIREMISLEYSQKKPGRAQVISRIERAKVLLDLIVRNMPSKASPESGNGAKGATQVGKGGRKPSQKNDEDRRKERRKSLLEAYRLGIEARRALARNDIPSATSRMGEIIKISRHLPRAEKMKLLDSVSEIEKDIKSASDNSIIKTGDAD